MVGYKASKAVFPRYPLPKKDAVFFREKERQALGRGGKQLRAARKICFASTR